MNKTGKTLSSGAAVAVAAVVSLNGFAKVEFIECPKCEKQIRISPDAKTAYVNLSRLDGVSKEVRAARAEKLLALAKPLPDTGVKRPLLGWSSWNTFGINITEDVIVESAKAMATNGLKEAGYLYVNIDDGFFCGHDKDGKLRIMEDRFPNGMKKVADEIHALGMKAGIYSDAGRITCSTITYGKQFSGSGLYGHDAEDCKYYFIDCGYDFIKVDYCGGARLRLNEKKRYTEISKAIKATGRDVRFNICRWRFPGTWAADVAESWRTTGDIHAEWNSVKRIVGKNLYLSAYCSKGHHNDMDMLEVGHLKGKVKTAFGKNDPGLTTDEEALHFGVWSIMSSPLLIGCDVRSIPEQTKALVTNPYLLAMGQNDLGVQAYVVQRVGADGYVLVKDADERFGTARYVALLNLSDGEMEFTVESKTLDLAGTVEVFDLLDRSDPGSFKDSFTIKVRPHAAHFYRFDAEKRLERTVYEAETAFLSCYQDLANPEKAGTAFPAGHAKASGGMLVRFLGKRDANDLIWKEVKIDRGGKRTLVFRYSSPDDRRFFLQIDGGEKIAVKTPPTRSNMNEVSVDVDLEPDVHSVRISSPDAWGPDIDVMYIR